MQQVISTRIFAASRLGVLCILTVLMAAMTSQAQTTRPARGGFGKNSPAVREAFDEIVAQASRSTVRIRGGHTETLGTIVSADGYIVTKASELQSDLRVTLKDQRQLPAQIVGIVDAVDLAMLKVDANDLTPIQWGDATEIDDGMWVASAGIWKDPVAVGMISLPGRRKIQVKRAYIGVQLEQAEKGPRIREVMDNSGAQKAGLKVNDLILAINAAPISKREEVTSLIGEQQTGTVVRLHILRDGAEQDVEVTLGPPPEAIRKRGERGAKMNQMGTSISARRDGFPAVIQHDSPLTANTCGGPLVSLEGKVIGINIARSGRVESFALPSDVVQSYLEDLKAGKYAPTTQPAPSTQP